MADIRVTSTQGKKPDAAKGATKKAAAPASAKKAEAPASAKKAEAPAVRKTISKKTATPRAQVDTHSRVTAEERQKMIAEEAYLRAERRGFTGGDPKDDWLAAEWEIDQILSRT
jgi:hypothetical protein